MSLISKLKNTATIGLIGITSLLSNISNSQGESTLPNTNYSEILSTTPLKTNLNSIEKNPIRIRNETYYEHLENEVIDLDVYGMPGARSYLISLLIKETETPENHHDIIAVQWGTNDAVLYGDNIPYMLRMYVNHIYAVVSNADFAGTKRENVYFFEVPPIASDVLVERKTPEELLQLETAIPALNQGLYNVSCGGKYLNTIKIYDEMDPHFNKEADAWCLNEANGDFLDGVHLSSLGAEALSSTLWNNIQDNVREKYLSQKSPREKIRVAIYGDSIISARALNPEDRPIAKLIDIINRDNTVPVELSVWEVE